MESKGEREAVSLEFLDLWVSLPMRYDTIRYLCVIRSRWPRMKDAGIR